MFHNLEKRRQQHREKNAAVAELDRKCEVQSRHFDRAMERFYGGMSLRPPTAAAYAKGKPFVLHWALKQREHVPEKTDDTWQMSEHYLEYLVSHSTGERTSTEVRAQRARNRISHTPRPWTGKVSVVPIHTKKHTPCPPLAITAS
jgi:hypothetical protein